MLPCFGGCSPLPETLNLFLRGMAAGLAISAPVGPVNVLCVSRTLFGGRKAGMISGLGAATADTIFGAIAAFSISFVISLLIRELFWIRLFGGILLIGIGIIYYFKKPRLPDKQETHSAHSDYVTAFFLTLTNPTAILSFIAVLAGLGISEARVWWLDCVVVAGVFFGAMLWWAILVVAANRFRDRVDERALLWMNRVAGLAIGGFGVITLILSQTKS